MWITSSSPGARQVTCSSLGVQAHNRPVRQTQSATCGMSCSRWATGPYHAPEALQVTRVACRSVCSAIFAKTVERSYICSFVTKQWQMGKKNSVFGLEMVLFGLLWQVKTKDWISLIWLFATNPKGLVIVRQNVSLDGYNEVFISSDHVHFRICAVFFHEV